MQRIQIKSKTKIKKAVPKIEKRLKVRLTVKGDNIEVRGNEVACFSAGKIIEAIDFGFDVDDALLLVNENFCLEFINIKKHTRRKNLEEVRGRVIGREGKAKKTIEELTGAVLVVHDNVVGMIVDSEHLDAAVQGLRSLIQGAKHGNVFAYLEKRNRGMKDADDDLGLRDSE